MSAWMLESALQVSVIVLIGLVSGAALRRQSAALRHWLLAVAVICAWGTAPLRLVLPEWLNTPLWHTSGRGGSQVGWPSEHTTSTMDGMSKSTPNPAPLMVAGMPVSRLRLSTEAAVGWTWIVGSLLSALTLLAGLARLRWLASRAGLIDTGPWREISEQVRVAQGLASPIRLLQSDHPSLLVTWGWRRPAVLLPAGANTWSRDRIEVVLTHELAHIARHDWLWHVVVQGLRAVYWFNPLLWIASRRLRAESERACDDAVLARGIAGPAYAAHLLALARTLHSYQRPRLPAPAMARPSSLEGRIHAMLNTRLNRHPVSLKARLATAGVLAVLTLPVAGLRSQSVFYTLSGTVLDSTDRVLPNTKLVLTKATNDAKYEIRSDASGQFEFVGLTPATYTLEAALPGFATFKMDHIIVAADVRRDLRLRVGSLQETITVRDSGAPTVAPDATVLQRREEMRRRVVELVQREEARCAAGGAASAIGGKILPPSKLVDARPIYPEHLQASKIDGTVTMDALIGIDGRVRDIRNLKGPHADLTRAAAEAVRQWQYSSTLLNCEPIEVGMNVTVNFAVRR